MGPPCMHAQDAILRRTQYYTPPVLLLVVVPLLSPFHPAPLGGMRVRAPPESSGTFTQLVSSALRLPGRTASLSLSLSTLPLALALFLVGLGDCPEVLDRALALCGLARTGRVSTEALAAQRSLRHAAARNTLATEQLQRSEAARLIAERALREALERARETTPLGAARRQEGPLKAPPVPAALAQALWATALVCAMSLSVASEWPHAAVERKLMTVVLGPSLLVFLSQRRTLGGALFCLCVHCWCMGVLSHAALHKVLM